MLELFEKACKELPEGYRVGIEFEQGAGYVYVILSEDVEFEWQEDGVSLEESFRRAIEWCKNDHKILESEI